VIIMNDDTLILYYYGDGLSARERKAVEAALEQDPPLAERYRELCRDLDQLREAPIVAAPAPAVARWHRAIEQAAAAERRAGGAPASRRPEFPAFAWAALAATLVAGIFIGLYLGGGGSPPAPTVAERGEVEAPAGDGRGAQATPVAFSRGLELHLRESRRELASLNGTPERTMLIMEILRQNRLFERSAQQHDAQDVARVLRAFEPILLRLADENISPAEAAALKAKLAFELDVVLTKMQQRESDETDSI
jgi:hypothetical protein